MISRRLGALLVCITGMHVNHLKVSVCVPCGLSGCTEGKKRGMYSKSPDIIGLLGKYSQCAFQQDLKLSQQSYPYEIIPLWC